jgi:uncharacterized membrane protein YfcA
VLPDLAVKMAIATSMATIIFTSISSVRAHHKRGAVRWDIVKRLAPGIVVGSIIGSLGVFALLKGSYLASSSACSWAFRPRRCSGQKAQAHAPDARHRQASWLPAA